ncbi:tail fiber assembly protein [Cronobacter turicensis]|nr:tail fiber assembly protein [Cronobacter turicensis]
MNVYIYSPERNSFFASVLKTEYQDAGTWPDDGLFISEEQHRLLMEGQAKGKTIMPDENGSPVLVDPPPPSREELIEEANLQKTKLLREAKDVITPLQYAVDLDIATEKERAGLDKWKRYLVLLTRADTTTAPDVAWPETPGDVA